MKTSVVVLTSLLATGVYADTIIPANDVEALTNAVNAATEGQVIVVSAGTYLMTEPMTLPAKHFVVLKGATGDPKDVVFDGGDRINILTISLGAMSNLVSGITFRNCRNSILGGFGGGMQSAGAAIRMLGHNNNVNTGTVISNCVFNGCHSDTGWGGAILMPGGTTVAGCVFTNCTSQMKGEDYSTAYGGAYGGGAIYAVAKSADVYIRDSSFVDCGCSNGVGVLNCGYYASHKRTLEDGSPSTNRFGAIVVNCGFTNNWSYGSSACFNLKVREIMNCRFKGNESRASVNFKGAAISGRSAIWCAEQGNNLGTSQQDLLLPDRAIKFLSCDFENNIGGDSAAIFAHGQNIPLCVSNCTFKANASACASGSLLGTGGEVELVDSTFIENYSTIETIRPGTGVEFNNYGLTGFTLARPKVIRRCRFFANRIIGGGGCVKFSDSNAEVSDCVFASNLFTRAGYPACPVSVDSATATNTLVRNCLFACNTNTSNSTGAQVYIGLGNTNNGNLGGTNAVIESCTFVGNRASNASWASNSGTVYIGHSGGTSKIRNCVFYDNKSMGGATSVRNFAFGGTGEGCYNLATYTCEDGSLVPTTEEKHNFSNTDPKFRDAAHGDYTPGPRSVLKGNGLFCDWMTAAVDLAGNPRAPDGKVDIGCYEHVRTGLMIFVR